MIENNTNIIYQHPSLSPLRDFHSYTKNNLADQNAPVLLKILNVALAIFAYPFLGIFALAGYPLTKKVHLAQPLTTNNDEDQPSSTEKSTQKVFIVYDKNASFLQRLEKSVSSLIHRDIKVEVLSEQEALEYSDKPYDQHKLLIIVDHGHTPRGSITAPGFLDTGDGLFQGAKRLPDILGGSLETSVLYLDKSKIEFHYQPDEECVRRLACPENTKHLFSTCDDHLSVEKSEEILKKMDIPLNVEKREWSLHL